MQRTAPTRPFARSGLPMAVLAALAACGQADRAEDPRPLVVCTTVMIGDLAAEIAGDDVRVRTLFGPDVDPHMFRPTRDDVSLLLGADLVLWNGLRLEGYLQDTLIRLHNEGVASVPVAGVAITEEQLLREGAAPDPHAWMDVALWSEVAARVGQEIANVCPQEARASVEGRTALLTASLLELDAEIADSLASIPEGSRVLVTAHDAFQYFGRRYSFEVHAVQGVSTTSEAGLRAIEDLVQLVVERRVPAVFFESTVSDRSVRALIEGAEAAGHEVSVGGILHSDAPGEAKTYAGMMRHNAREIREALAGIATEVGAAR